MADNPSEDSREYEILKRTIVDIQSDDEADAFLRTILSRTDITDLARRIVLAYLVVSDDRSSERAGLIKSAGWGAAVRRLADVAHLSYEDARSVFSRIRDLTKDAIDALMGPMAKGVSTGGSGGEETDEAEN